MSLPLEITSADIPPMPSKIKTLLLDDSNFDRARIRRMSARSGLSMQLDEVGSIAEMSEVLTREAYDLILIDYRLPTGDGLDAMEAIKHQPLNKDAAMVMITGQAGLETAVTAMRNGCHDFLSKDRMTSDSLDRTMKNALSAALRQRNLVAQAAQQNEVIRRGLSAALDDEDVQNKVISLFAREAGVAKAFGPQWQDQQSSDLDVMISGLWDDDEFLFH